MEKTTNLQNDFLVSPCLTSLPYHMRLKEPSYKDPAILEKISAMTNEACAEEPIELFNPYDACWMDGSMAYEDDLRDVKNYFEYLKALDGSGVPSYLTIRHIDDFIGHGVYAARDIAKGEFIGFYTGEWTLKENPSSSYLFEAIDGTNIFIDAANSGNFTRYINHAYSKRCNLEAIIYLKKQGALHLPLVIYYAKKRIAQGEQLLINYGRQYWNLMGFRPS